MSDLEDALRHQRFFWRFVGIVSCVILVIMLFAVLAGAGLAMFRYNRF